MPSLQSCIFRLILKYRHLLRFQLKSNESFDFNTSIPHFREKCEKSAKLLGKIPVGIEVTPFTIDGIYGEWIIPSGAVKDKVILYTHGGGYVSGSCSDHRAIVARLLKGCGISTLLFEYRLAPENPFPAALDDSVALTAGCWPRGFLLQIS